MSLARFKHTTQSALKHSVSAFKSVAAGLVVNQYNWLNKQFNNVIDTRYVVPAVFHMMGDAFQVVTFYNVNDYFSAKGAGSRVAGFARTFVENGIGMATTVGYAGLMTLGKAIDLSNAYDDGLMKGVTGDLVFQTMRGITSKVFEHYLPTEGLDFHQAKLDQWRTILAGVKTASVVTVMTEAVRLGLESHHYSIAQNAFFPQVAGITANFVMVLSAPLLIDSNQSIHSLEEVASYNSLNSLGELFGSEQQYSLGSSPEGSEQNYGALETGDVVDSIVHPVSEEKKPCCSVQKTVKRTTRAMVAAFPREMITGVMALGMNNVLQIGAGVSGIAGYFLAPQTSFQFLQCEFTINLAYESARNLMRDNGLKLVLSFGFFKEMSGRLFASSISTPYLTTVKRAHTPCTKPLDQDEIVSPAAATVPGRTSSHGVFSHQKDRKGVVHSAMLAPRPASALGETRRMSKTKN